MTNIQTRPSADATRKKILQAAEKLFVKQGFAATPISQIAKSAGINQSLIYHHFGNKKGLWQQVKHHLLEHNFDELLNLFDKEQSFDTFIRELLNLRFDLYQKKPAMLRMIQWQQLEHNEQLFGTDRFSIDRFLAKISDFQKRNCIRQDLAPIYILNLILSLSAASYDTSRHIQIKTQDEKATYLRFIIDTLIKTLRIQNEHRPLISA
jgi:AcrR family transcriptional regulator